MMVNQTQIQIVSRLSRELKPSITNQLRYLLVLCQALYMT